MTQTPKERAHVVDLCAGTGSATIAFHHAGYVVERVEIEEGRDVRLWKPQGDYVFAWGSPPCPRFSPSGHFWGWDKETLEPTEPETREALEVAHAVLDAVQASQAPWWVIENPMGLLRRMPRYRDLPRVQVSYCRYGDTRQKMTDLFTNIPPSVFRGHCKNRMPCHAPAPRGSKTPGSTQGLKDRRLRGMVPRQLSDDLLAFVQREVAILV